jgi:hypothetical protein
MGAVGELAGEALRSVGRGARRVEDFSYWELGRAANSPKP